VDAVLTSGEGMRALVELSPDAVFVILDGYHVFANARGIALLGGRTLADIQTRPALEFMDMSCRDVATERLVTMVDRREVLEYVEERIIRLDGTTRDTEAAGTPLEVDGRPAALVVVRDITARKQSEAALAAAQRRFRTAFEHAPAGMAILDADGDLVDANPALGDLFGRSAEDLVGQSIWAVVPADGADDLRRALRRVLTGDVPVEEGRFPIDDPDGTERWLAGSAAVVEATGTYVLHLSDVTAQVAAEEDLARQALLDPLTGLVNRRCIEERLNALLDRLPRTHGTVSVLFCDLDGFKVINDQFGHAAGDEVLREVSRRLLGAVRPGDVVGRIGGDEFAIVVDGDVVDGRLADRLTRAVAPTIALHSGRVRVGVSIGVASTTVPKAAAELLAEADAAMYGAKALARPTVDR
jgi:diguanylate cyclase (GGDEF)-like protein/PAS domain S-box-containing protein